jgi:hypothetical protein
MLLPRPLLIRDTCERRTEGGLQRRTPSIKLFFLAVLCTRPGWRNWQTQRTQNPPGFGPWGFDSPSRHQRKH